MEKRLQNMRTNPSAGWTIGDVESLCRAHKIACAAARGGGSHYKISHPSQMSILTVPSRRPIKPVYIRKLVAFIDAVDSAI